MDSLYDKWASLDIMDSQAKYKRLRGVCVLEKEVKLQDL